MRELKLRKLATPLKEARRDPRIDKPALFVEGLFGRPLKCNPLIIAVTDENREEFVKLVEEDFSNVLGLYPFPGRYSQEQRDDFERRNIFLLGLPDIFRPRKTMEAIKEVRANGLVRVELKMIAGVKEQSERWVKKHGMTQGVSLNRAVGSEMIVYQPTETNEMLVHEIVHSEDHFLFDKVDQPLERLYREGRAYYAERIYQISHGELYHNHNEFGYLPYLFRHFCQNDFAEARKWAAENGTLELLKRLADSIVHTSWQFQTTNYPFMAALMRLADAVGSAPMAFQITTEKPPQTRLQVEMSLTYYRDEIEKTRSVQ